MAEADEKSRKVTTAQKYYTEVEDSANALLAKLQLGAPLRAEDVSKLIEKTPDMTGEQLSTLMVKHTSMQAYVRHQLALVANTARAIQYSYEKKYAEEYLNAQNPKSRSGRTKEPSVSDRKMIAERHPQVSARKFASMQAKNDVEILSALLHSHEQTYAALSRELTRRLADPDYT